MAMHRAVTSPSECGVLRVAKAVASAMIASTTRQAGGASAAAQDTDATRLDPSTRLRPAHVRENQELQKSSPGTFSPISKATAFI